MGIAFIRVIRLWLVLLAEQLLLFPVSCIIYSLSGIRSLFLFMASYLLLDLVAMLAREFLPKRWRPWLLLTGMVLGAGIVFLFSPNLVFRIVMPFILAIILWHGVRMVELGTPTAVFTSFILLGFALHPFITWVFNQTSRFQEMIPVLAFTGTAGILLSLILVNRQQIRDAGSILERRLHLPGTLMRKNALYVGVFLLLAVAGAAWEFFGHLITSLFGLFGKLVAAIIWLVNLLTPVSEETAAPPPPASAAEEILPMEGTTPLWLEILQTVILVLAAIGAIILVVWGIVRLVKKAIPLVRKGILFLVEWLKQFFLGDKHHASEDPGFVDEVESLLKQNESSFAAARRWLSERMDLEPGFGSMKTDAERIRWLYRNLVRREIRHGYEVLPSGTPSEIVVGIAAFQPAKRRLSQPSEAADLYGLVRYSDEEVGPEEVREMKKALSTL